MTNTPPDRNHGKHVCTWAQHPPTPSFLGKRAPAAEFAGAQADEATATCKVGALPNWGKGLGWRMPRSPNQQHRSASKLPCLTCQRGTAAREEIITSYLNFLRGERRLRFDDRPRPLLPRACCKQAKPDVAALIA